MVCPPLPAQAELSLAARDLALATLAAEEAAGWTPTKVSMKLETCVEELVAVEEQHRAPVMQVICCGKLFSTPFLGQQLPAHLASCCLRGFQR